MSQCRRTAWAAPWGCSRTWCTCRRYHPRKPAGRGGGDSRRWPLRRPGAPCMSVRARCCVNSRRRDGCRCHRWPGTGCPGTILGRTLPACGRPTSAPARGRACGCRAAGSSGPWSRKTGPRRSTPGRLPLLCDPTVLLPRKIKRFFCDSSEI